MNAKNSRRKAAPAHERHLRLLHMLLTSRIGFSKAEIFNYLSAHYPTETEKERMSSDKMFQRDRETLAKLGIIVENITINAFDGEDVHRYRIKPDTFSFPEDIQFSPEEFLLLELAGRAWTGTDLGSTASHGVQRLQPNLDTLDEQLNNPTTLPGLTLDVPLQAYETLQSAISERKQISFQYQKFDGKASERRTVEPINILYIFGDWLLYAWEGEKSNYRSFRLSRIYQPKISDVDISFELTTELRNQARQDIEEYFRNNIVKVRVREGSLAEVSLGHRGDLNSDNVLTMPFLDVETLVNELSYFGPDITVISPDTVKNALVSRFQRLKQELDSSQQLSKGSGLQ